MLWAGMGHHNTLQSFNMPVTVYPSANAGHKQQSTSVDPPSDKLELVVFNVFTVWLLSRL